MYRQGSVPNEYTCCPMEGMKEISEVRLENARALAKLAGGTGAFAARIDREPTQASRFMGKNPTKKIGDRLARHIEECFGKPRGWLDTDHQADSAPPEAALQGAELAPAPRMKAAMAPEISWVKAGHFTEVAHIEVDPESVNWYPMPPNAGERTFVLRVVGESMLPEYPPQRLIYVDPDRAPVSGDDVVAVMTDTGEATFKRYIEEPGSSKMLKALNPAWVDPYIKINGNCQVVGVVVADLQLR